MWRLTANFTLVIAIVFLRLGGGCGQAGGGARQLQWTAKPSSARFATSEIVERCVLSVWTALDTGSMSTIWRVRLTLCAPFTSRRPANRANSPARRALWRVLLIAAIAGDIELNPGPPRPAPVCVLCDRHGRRNQIKIECGGTCKQIFHASCLKASPAERKKWKNGNGGFFCLGCTFPFTKSLLSLPDAVAAQPAPDAAPRRDSKAAFFLCFNARSLKNRKRSAEIDALLDRHPADVLAINETWLSKDVLDHEVISGGYTVLRKDRDRGRRAAGGVLLAILPHLQPRRQELLETDAEAVWAAIQVGNLRVLVGSVYRAPNSTTEQNAELLLSLSLAANQQDNFDACFVMGDLNLDIDWQVDPPIARAAPAADFMDAFAELALTQHIKGPTRTTATSEKTIDLLLCNRPNLVATAEVIDGVSDHDALLCHLNLDSRRPKPPPCSLPDFRRADWEALNEQLAQRMQPILMESDLTTAWEAWKATLFKCVEELVPMRRTSSKRRLQPWMDKGLKKLLDVKEALFARWHSEKTPAARELFLAARKAAQGAVRLAKDRWFWALGRGPGGAGVFWKYIHSKSKVPLNTTSFKAGGRVVSESQEVASQFLSAFKKNFSSAATDFPFVRRPAPLRPTITEVSITAADVHNLLQAMDAKSATGPDGVPAQLLRQCARSLSSSLAHIFTLSLRTQELPADWKIASVAPIPKDGDKKDINNYRPISVTSLVGKLLERFVRDRLADFFEANNIIPDCQHGFRSRRSCTTMLARTLDDWATTLDRKSGARVHVVFLDWSKAFDKVPHERLLSKLQFLGVDGAALGWLRSFLVGRTQFVKFNGARSEFCEVASGVIQGSVLGPLLFNVFVSDLPSVIKTNLVQYADDCTIYTEIKSEEDIKALQEDLANIDLWCTNNGMQLNAKKCVAMDISRARAPLTPAYTIGGAALDYVSTQRLLGVHIARDLRWNHHVSLQQKKAAQRLGFAARNLHGCTPRVKRLAYMTLVKPIIFYGTPAWHPSTATNMQKMERVQKRALHFIHGRRLPAPEKQQMFPVEEQLKYNELLFFKKCLSGATDFDPMARITLGRTLRGDDPLRPRLQPPPARTDLGESVFAFRVVSEWNRLPPALHDCPAAQFPELCQAHLWRSVS